MTEEETVEIPKSEVEKLARTYRYAAYLNGIVFGGMLPAFTYSMILKPLNLGSLVEPFIVPGTLVSCLAGSGYVYYKLNIRDSDE